MRKLMSKVQQWAHRTTRAAEPFAVVCNCGGTVRGRRQSRHQELPCPECGRPVFVLPYSPLPFPDDEEPATALAIPKGWRRPLIATGVATVLLAVLLVVFVLWVTRTGPAPTAAEPTRADLDLHLQEGKRALAGGKFRVSANEFAAAGALLEQKPVLLTADEQREFTQYQRQAALLADLLSESLQEILRQAGGLGDDEWRVQFADRYRGRAVVFDADVARELDGRVRLDYQVRSPTGAARLDLDRLTVLRALPLVTPRRLLFGGRLAAIEREPPGRWVIRFEPESGVLITDRDAAAACCTLPPDDGLFEVVDRQAAWVAGPEGSR